MLRVALVGGLLAAIAAPAVSAPVQWVSGPGANGHFYEFVAFDGDWLTANTLAQSRTLGTEQGALVSIHSTDENAFVYGLLLAEEFPFQAAAWLGGFQTPPSPELLPKADWHWTSRESFGFTQWYRPTSEPNNLGGFENFLQMYNYGNGGWNDCTSDCANNNMGFIVEYGSRFTPAPVPELATWVGLVIGFGLVGHIARRKHVSSAANTG